MRRTSETGASPVRAPALPLKTGHHMIISKSEPPAMKAMDAEDEGLEKVNQVEAEIRDFVRRDLHGVRRTADATEAVASNINTLVQRVAGSTLREIDVLLRELEGLRDLLHSE